MPRAPALDPRALYLNLMERCILNLIYEDPPDDNWSPLGYDAERRAFGADWPSQAHSMIGVHRISNLRRLVERVLKEKVPGDLIETGVWRGGACIYMRAILLAYGVTERRVFAADSFEGLPPPDPEKYPHDANNDLHTFPQLSVSLEEVRANFEKYALLDDQVVFLKGWFKDTLPAAPIERLAILRLDGDLYESTMDGLVHLYDKLSPGGFVIVDDYNLPGTYQAVLDFRVRHGLGEPIINIDNAGAYWQKMSTEGHRGRWRG